MLTLPFKLTNAQEKLVDNICDSIERGNEYTTLQSVVGSGKTPIWCAVIDRLKIPTLIFSHNKILAKQLYDEVRIFNSDDVPVNYFISHFEHYQAECYIPQIDKFFEKETIIDKEIDRQRVLATADIITTPFNITVASVSAIFGAGFPHLFEENTWTIKVGDKITIKEFATKLVELYYERVGSVNELKWYNQFVILGDRIFTKNLRRDTLIITLAWDTIEKIIIENHRTLKQSELGTLDVYPAQHCFTVEERRKTGIELLKQDLQEQVDYFRKLGKIAEAIRIEERTKFDIELIEEIGYVRGMENYVKYFSPWNLTNNRPTCLLDYYRHRFGNKFLTICEESHCGIPQVRGMVNGVLGTKQNLIDYGFRLPSCTWNRPLSLDEFLEVSAQKLFVSATPGKFELENTPSSSVFSLYLRPTAIVDPEVTILPVKTQLDSILEVLSSEKDTTNQSLILTFTKKDAEHLAEFLRNIGYNAVHLHSSIKPKERIQIFEKIRQNEFKVICGILCFKEGIDLPNLTNVFILDADKEGFLRNETSLTQMAGRAARNVNGKVYLFADVITKSIKAFLDGTHNKRKIQLQYNLDNNISPSTVKKHIPQVIQKTPKRKDKMPIGFYKEEIVKAAKNQEFEIAVELRDDFKFYYPKAFKSFSLKH